MDQMTRRELFKFGAAGIGAAGTTALGFDLG